jgi:hypothetical protein
MNQTEYLTSLDDAELKRQAGICYDDLQIAANMEHNSNWHESCFAAAVMFAQELNRRGIEMRTLN